MAPPQTRPVDDEPDQLMDGSKLLEFRSPSGTFEYSIRTLPVPVKAQMLDDESDEDLPPPMLDIDHGDALDGPSDIVSAPQHQRFTDPHPLSDLLVKDHCAHPDDDACIRFISFNGDLRDAADSDFAWLNQMPLAAVDEKTRQTWNLGGDWSEQMREASFNNKTLKEKLSPIITAVRITNAQMYRLRNACLTFNKDAQPAFSSEDFSTDNVNLVFEAVAAEIKVHRYEESDSPSEAEAEKANGNLQAAIRRLDAYIEAHSDDEIKMYKEKAFQV
ncbi:uncharacterized protein LOC62_01G001338 [Vanrija pseudolonga]|uniref:Uncharacterized protein n=1 Tax=Vanrija pseudolonga TaxID=143232 RepID=A0AAF1BFA1_9TREE|nr:hypothetical protein LOC62_01G001338 [Vanrija pseudolonga]